MFWGKNGSGTSDLKYIGVTKLKDYVDLKGEESINLLKQVDIVITNPPFPLFQKYVSPIIEYEKYFIIIGNKNTLTFKEIFKLVKENKVWLGYDNDGTKWF